MATSKIESASLASDAVDNTNIDSTLITAQTEKSSLVDADKFLISDSAASGALKYVQKSNLPSGTLVQTGRTVISGGNPSTVDVDNCFSSTYDSYLVVVDRIESTVDSQTLFFRLKGSGGVVSASNYRFSNAYFEDDGNTERQFASASSRFEITNDTDDSSNNGGLQGLLYVHRPADANTMTRMNMHYSFYNNTANDLKIAISTSTYENPEAHTGIRLGITSGGVRDAGSITVYGIAYS